MEKIFEVIRIKQEIQETQNEVARTVFRSPYDAAKVATKLIGDEDREVFLVMCLNSKNEIVGAHRCHVGTINCSVVSTRDVFKTAILNNSNSVIVAHNHPSYNLQQSSEDIQVTKKLAEAGKLMDIELLDSLIVNAYGDFISLKEKGYI